MSQEKYIGMDVHQATISVAVMDASGKLIMEPLRRESEVGAVTASLQRLGDSQFRSFLDFMPFLS